MKQPSKILTLVSLAAIGTLTGVPWFRFCIYSHRLIMSVAVCSGGHARLIPPSPGLPRCPPGALLMGERLIGDRSAIAAG